MTLHYVGKCKQLLLGVGLQVLLQLTLQQCHHTTTALTLQLSITNWSPPCWPTAFTGMLLQQSVCQCQYPEALASQKTLMFAARNTAAVTCSRLGPQAWLQHTCYFLQSLWLCPLSCKHMHRHTVTYESACANCHWKLHAICATSCRTMAISQPQPSAADQHSGTLDFTGQLISSVSANIGNCKYHRLQLAIDQEQITQQILSIIWCMLLLVR